MSNTTFYVKNPVVIKNAWVRKDYTADTANGGTFIFHPGLGVAVIDDGEDTVLVILDTARVPREILTKPWSKEEI